MVSHGIRVLGTDLTGVAAPKAPVIMQMKTEDFPARFLQDLLTPQNPPISSAAVVGTDKPTLFQPVQRMLTVALIDLTCNTSGFPRVDPKRIQSAGMVVRRVVRRRRAPGAPVQDDADFRAGWMCNAKGQWGWRTLSKAEEDLDPDPTRRPALQSGDPVLDSQLAAMVFANAYSESTTPAFAAPPATCAAIDRTVLYGLIPTASSEMSDVPPQAPAIQPADLRNSLPSYLLAGGYSNASVLSGTSVDVRWMSDDFLANVYPSTTTLPTPVNRPTGFAAFQQFALTLRMLTTVFAAFEPTASGQAVLAILNRHHVTLDAPIAVPSNPLISAATVGMGDFFAYAKANLLDYQAYGSSAQPPSMTMPTSWDWLNAGDESDLIKALLSAAASQSPAQIAPQGRFQDDTRLYMLRMFVRVKSEHPNCPPKLVWSRYSQEFFIAPWHASSQRAHAPIPLPDPTKAFMKGAKPNCSFQVPGSLMGAMQGTTMSGLTSGSGGGPALKLGWICGFNIPLITICAFFVLNIFLMLLNIVFFWLPIIKICIPIPAPSTTEDPPG